MKAIILAGGLGTRLKGVIGEIPKPMAIVNNAPFLEYLLKNLDYSIIDEVILSVGYKYEVIKEYFGDNFKGIPLKYSIENKPLGTGGGINLAMKKIESNQPILILNGDTYFDFNLEKFYKFHKNNNSDFSLCLKEMKKFDRYGSVQINKNNKILGFNEKKYLDSGLINCGVYLIEKTKFSNLKFPNKFSFEKDYMEKHTDNLNFYGHISDGYFIDIGIPEDFQKAQIELI